MLSGVMRTLSKGARNRLADWQNEQGARSTTTVELIFYTASLVSLLDSAMVLLRIKRNLQYRTWEPFDAVCNHKPCSCALISLVVVFTRVFSAYRV